MAVVTYQAALRREMLLTTVCSFVYFLKLAETSNTTRTAHICTHASSAPRPSGGGGHSQLSGPAGRSLDDAQRCRWRLAACVEASHFDGVKGQPGEKPHFFFCLPTLAAFVIVFFCFINNTQSNNNKQH